MSSTDGQIVKDIEIVVDGKIFRFQIKLMAGDNPPPPPPPPQSQVLKIVQVVTSADDGNKGENMLVDDAARWSCQGIACTATFDLGGVQEVGEIYLRFFKGAERTENFEIGLSSDGTTYTTITESQQDQAAAIISITPSLKTRYVRLIGKGNNVNDWNSVEFVKISGKQLVQPPPTPEPCPAGSHRDLVTGECVPDGPPPPPNGGELDANGVKKIYPSVGSDFGFTFKSSNEGRAQWIADTGKCIVNKESTVYLNMKKVTNMGEEISIKDRGGSHSSSAPAKGCCYIGGIGYDGSVNAQYECPHPNNHPLKGYKIVTPNVAGNDIVGKWIGLKFIVFVQGDHDHLECWVDPDGLEADGTPANNFKKFWEGDSTEFTGKCAGNNVYIRCDDVEGAPKNPQAEIKFASTREIKVTGGGAAAATALMVEDSKSPKLGRDLAKHKKWGDIPKK